MGFGAHRVAGGGDAHAASLSPLRRTAFTPSSGLPTGPGMFSTDAAHAAYLCCPCRFSRSGSRWTTFHAFAWVLPGRSRQDRFHRHRVNGDGFPGQGQLPSNRCLFAWARLTPHLDTDALRAASGILAHPHARRLHRHWPGYETAVGAPTHRFRIARRLFRPQLRLRPRFLAGEEGSTPWTRSPFTPRRPRGRPGRYDRWRSFYETSSGRLSTSANCKIATYEHTHELGSSQRDEGLNPLRVLCPVVTRPSRGTRPTGREPPALVKSPRIRFPPVRGLADPIMSSYHPPRRRLAAAPTGGPGSVGR
jgi:hypothetical protein